MLRTSVIGSLRAILLGWAVLATVSVMQAAAPPSVASAASADWKLHRPATTPDSATGSRESDAAGVPILVLRKTITDEQGVQFWWMRSQAGQGGESYRIRFEARARPLDGAGGEYNVSAGLAVQGAEGKWLGFFPLHTIARHSVKWPAASRPAVPEWKSFDKTFTLPASATTFTLRLALDGNGAAEGAFRNISIEKSSVAVAEALAALPKNIPLFKIDRAPVSANGVSLTPDWTLDGAPLSRSATRAKVPLNALWAIQPANAAPLGGPAAVTPPRADDWAFFKVPGYFNRRLYSVYGQEKTSWPKRDLYSDPAGLWYARDVEIPAPTASGSAEPAVFFEVGGMWGYAVQVYWNGQAVGSVTDQLGGRVALPASVRPGDRGQIALYAFRVEPESRSAWRSDFVRSYRPDTEFKSDWAKGFHDLYLVVAPRSEYLSDIKLTPSVRNRTLDVDLVSPSSAERVLYRLEVRDAGGRTAFACEMGPGSAAAAQANWRVSWEVEPRYWTPDDPHLYTAIVKAADERGRILDESLPQTFGFREIEVAGRELRFNGHPLRLRPRIMLLQFGDNAAIRRQFSFFKDMGFNCVIRPQAGGTHELEGAARMSADAFFSIADEMGMLVIPYLPYNLVNGGQFGGETIPEDDLRELLRYVDAHQITRFYNHPSIVAWSGFGFSPSQGINPVATSPDAWGITPLHQDGALDAFLAAGDARDTALRRLRSSRRFVEGVKALDSTRPFLAHNDGGQGDGWGYFDYFNWTPRQEWEEWPRQWVEKGVMPIGSTEHGLPYPGSFINHAPAGGDGEPWATEYAAMGQGPAAYARETAAYLSYTSGLYDPKVKNFSKDIRNPPHDSGKIVVERAMDGVQPVWADHNRAVYRAWRTYGVPMGIEPFGPATNYVRDEVLVKGNGAVVASPTINLKTVGAKADLWTPHGYWISETMLDYPEAPTGLPPARESLKPLGAALVENNSPFLGYIAGAPQRFTEKSHGFWMGDTVRKQVALVWDGFRPLELEVNWTAKLAGKSIASDRSTVTLSPGEIRFQPVTFALSEPALPADADGLIELVVKDRAQNRILFTDTFSFRAYLRQPSDTGLASARIALYDPAGESTAVCSTLGLNPTPISDLARLPADLRLLIVGRRALGSLPATWLSGLPASAAVLFLEQTEADLGRLGFRAYPARPRRMFTLPGGSPLLPGDLRDAELADWNVRPTLLPASSAPLRDGYNFNNGYQGALASVTIETPSLGNFTPHLQTGFDLRETALLETVVDGRRLVFCQLSLPEAVGSEPVATRIAASVMGNLVAQPTVVVSPLVLIGDESLLALARELGAAAPVSISADHLADASSGVLLLEKLPDDPRESAALRAWVVRGGRALVLPQAEIAAYRRVFSEAPSEIALSMTHLSSLPPAADDDTGVLLRGLGQNDLHAREELVTVLFGGKSPIASFPVGDGRVVLLGFDPRRIDVAKSPWLRLTRAHRYRVLSQLLTNLRTDLSAPTAALLAALGEPARKIEIGDAARARQLRAPAAASSEAGWTKTGFDDSAWAAFDLKAKQTDQGHALLRISFRAPPVLPAGPLVLDLGTVDDFDEAWLNGVKVGATTPATTSPDTAYSIRRVYPIGNDVLKAGAENVIAIRLWNRNADSKGWKAWLRGPVGIYSAARGSISALYPGEHRRADDPYLQYHW